MKVPIYVSLALILAAGSYVLGHVSSRATVCPRISAIAVAVPRVDGAGKTRYLPYDDLPDHYQQSQYVVIDWERHDLASPPAGFRWIRMDRDHQYLLASQTSGNISQTVDQEIAQ